MTAQLTNAAKDALLKGLSGKDNPFGVTKKGKRFVRYDSLRIENTSFGLVTTFVYRKLDVMHISTPYVSFKTEDSLHIVGIKGKMEINFDT